MIYVCIPAHDEERTIGVLLWKVRKVMAEFGRDYEILVFDDASTDRTREIVERYGPLLPVKLVGSEERVGYGRAIDRLFRETVERSAYPKRDVAVTLQGDFSEEPEDLVAMVKAIEGGADLVAGSLSTDPEALPRPVRWARRLAPRLLGRTYRSAPVTDPLAGFRAYRIVVLKKALRELEEGRSLVESSGWGANLEILAKVAPHARRIEEVPVGAAKVRRQRPSRFRAFGELWDLVALRGTSWPRPEEG